MDQTKEKLSILTTFILSFWIVLICQGIYWDDWSLYQVLPKWRSIIFDQTGRPLYSYLHNALYILTEEVFLAKIVSFIFTLVPVFIFNYLLKRISSIKSTDRLILVLLFAIIPINFARVSVTITQYTFSYAAFFTAFYLLDHHLKTKSILARITSLTLFYMSFNMDSLLVFYLIPACYFLYIKKELLNSKKNFYLLIKRHLDFLLLPILFFCIKSNFFKPHGFYTGYNSLSIDGLKNTPKLMATTTNLSIKEIFLNSLSLATDHYIATIIFFILFLIILKINIKEPAKEYTHKILQEKVKISFCWLIFGVFSFCLAIFPYNAVNIIPSQVDWESRHQILMPLGITFFILYFIKFSSSLILLGISRNLTAKKINLKLTNRFDSALTILIVAVFLSIFTVKNNLIYIDYLRDWQKQSALIKIFRSSDIISKNTLLLVDDLTMDMNAASRYYRYYEFTGLLKQSFKEETRLASLYDRQPDMEHIKKVIPYGHYNLRGFVPISPQFKISINYKNLKPNRLESLKSLMFKFINPKRYNKRLENMFELSYEEVN